MSVDAALTSLIEDAYAAALEPARWPDWAWRVATLLEGTCSSLTVVHVSGRFDHQTIRHQDMRVIERHVDDGIGRLDPRAPHAVRLRTCCVYTDTDHLDLDDRATPQYLAWERSNGDLRHHVTAVVPLPGGDRLAGLSIHRRTTDGPTPPAHRDLMTALLPHFARAVTLGYAHSEKLTDAYRDGLMSERAEPCALIAEDARILRTTGALEAVLVGEDGLCRREGRLVEARGQAGGPLEALIAAALGDAPQAGSCRVRRTSGRHAYVLTACPVPRAMCFPAPMAAAALVTVIDPDGQPCAPVMRWRQAFAFSVREAELAALLMAGHSVGSAAESLSISGATVRVHLRNLFHKADVSRQSDLLRLLSRCS